MTKEELKTYHKLEEKINQESMKLLKWYHENIKDGLWKIDHLSFDYIDEGIIYYEGWDNGDSDSFRLPEDLLTMNEKELEEFKIKYFKEKEEKEKIKEKLRDKEKRIQKERFEKERYQLYLELKEKYEK